MSNNSSHRQNEICYAETVDPTHLWGINTYPLHDSLPRLVMQMALAVAINHGFLFIFRRFRQPRFVSNLMTALVVSPSTLSKIHDKLAKILIPTKTLTILETVANLGLLYAAFIDALQANDIPIHQTRPKIFFHSCLAFISPFFVGYSLHFAAQSFNNEESTTLSSNNFINITSIYWGAIITSTTFTSIAPILSKLKLLCTQIGQETLFVSLFNDFCTWVLINVILAISTSPHNYNKINFLNTLCILVSMVVYMVFCCMLVKPTISRIISCLPEGENHANFAAQMILFLVLASGFITDYIGSHFIFGAYILGRCVPPGVLAETIVEKMEECVDGVLMPLYFMMIGIKLDIFNVVSSNIKYTAWIIAFAIATKGLCTLVTGVCCNVSLGESLSLGVLLNAKGLLPLVLLNVGYERGLITSESFTMLYLTILLSTMTVGPIMSYNYKRIKISYQSNDQKTLEGAEFSGKLRLITCIHASRNIPSILNLLEISNIIKPEYPALVYVTHLVELVGHASAFLTEHEGRDSMFWTRFLSSKIFFDRARVRSNHVIKAFNEYMSDEDKATNRTMFKILTVVSPFDTMHEDICSLAEYKKASLIILPFHKQQGVDGVLEDVDIEFGGVNHKVLEMAPCSVGLLVDRGLRVMQSSTTSDMPLSGIGRGRDCVHVAMVFIGGPGDREALTYAWRMILGQQSHVHLTLIRFVEGDHVMGVDQVVHYLKGCNANNKVDVPSLYELKETQNQIDDEFLDAFEQKTIDNESVNYLNYMVNSGDEVIESLRDLDHDFDLYIVGRGKMRFSLLTLGLVEWNLCNELGVIGNILVSSDFTSNASVLVLQQYHGGKVNQYNFEGNGDEEDSVLVDSYHEP